jgi:hypothetical protein
VCAYDRILKTTCDWRLAASFWQLAASFWQLAVGNWLTASANMMTVFQIIQFISNAQLAAG